eukprot:10611-Pyramimonas_sp.AAC.1
MCFGKSQGHARKGTAISVDGFHMRHDAAMSDGALVVLMSIFNIMEATAVVLHHARSRMISLLTKKVGGWRPRGFFVILQIA